MIVIHKDDVALAREGIETLNEKHLKEVSEWVVTSEVFNWSDEPGGKGGGLSFKMN